MYKKAYANDIRDRLRLLALLYCLEFELFHLILIIAHCDLGMLFSFIEGIM